MTHPAQCFLPRDGFRIDRRGFLTLAAKGLVVAVALPATGRRAEAATAGELASAYVHVGSDGVSPAALRRVVPARFIIGVSVAADDEIARAAGADYVGIGPVFVAGRGSITPALGVARFAELAKRCGLPAVAVGGITPETAGSVLAAGGAGVAVISALLGASDPMLAARAIRSALDASGS